MFLWNEKRYNCLTVRLQTRGSGFSRAVEVARGWLVEGSRQSGHSRGGLGTGSAIQRLLAATPRYARRESRGKVLLWGCTGLVSAANVEKEKKDRKNPADSSCPPYPPYSHAATLQHCRSSRVSIHSPCPTWEHGATRASAAPSTARLVYKLRREGAASTFATGTAPAPHGTRQTALLHPRLILPQTRDGCVADLESTGGCTAICWEHRQEAGRSHHRISQSQACGGRNVTFG